MKTCMIIIVATGLLAGVLGTSYAMSVPALSETRKITPKTELTGGVKTLPPKRPINVNLSVSECRAVGGVEATDDNCPLVDGKRRSCNTIGGTKPCIDEAK